MKRNKRKYINQRLSACICVLLTLIVLRPVFAGSVDQIRVLKISGSDERAVVKMVDSKEMKIIKPGDVIGENAIVKEIAEGRVMIEEKSDDGVEKVIIRLDGGKQRVERMKKMGEKAPQNFSSPTKDAKEQGEKDRKSGFE